MCCCWYWWCCWCWWWQPARRPSQQSLWLAPGWQTLRTRAAQRTARDLNNHVYFPVLSVLYRAARSAKAAKRIGNRTDLVQGGRRGGIRNTWNIPSSTSPPLNALEVPVHLNYYFLGSSYSKNNILHLFYTFQRDHVLMHLVILFDSSAQPSPWRFSMLSAWDQV